MNIAHQILQALGVPVGGGQSGTHGNRNPSATKAGPGRYHEQRYSKSSPSRKPAGAPRGHWVSTNPKRNTQRKALQAFKALNQHQRAAARLAAKGARNA